MVAVIRCGRDEEEHIEFYRRLRGAALPEWTWTTNRPRRLWPSGAHLTVLVTSEFQGDSQVTMLGWTRRVRRVDDLNQKLEVSRIYAVEPPLRAPELFTAVAGPAAKYLKEDGQQTPGAGQSLIDAICGSAQAGGPLSGTSKPSPTSTNLAHLRGPQVMAQQRDTSIGIGRMAGFDVAELADWSAPPDPLSDNQVPPTFLSRVADERAHEDQLINQDMHTMLGWVSDATRPAT